MLNGNKYFNSLKGVSTRKKYQTHLGAINDNTPTSRSSTGYKGVYKKHIKLKNGKEYYYFEARIQINKKEVILGSFYTIEEAIAARYNAAKKYYEPIIEEAKINGDFK